MVYNNNKKMSGRYMTASESDNVAADPEPDKGIVGTVEPELNHDMDEDYDVVEDVDVGINTGFKRQVLRYIYVCKNTSYSAELVHRILNALSECQCIAVIDSLCTAIIKMQRVGAWIGAIGITGGIQGRR